MSRTRKLSLAAALATTLAISVPMRSLAQDNAAVAINTRDGSSIFRLAFNVHRVMADVVDTTNTAIAFSSCEECRTVAVAIQLVLILSDPDVASPENYAVAINSDCSFCTTVALAYQYVLTTGGPVRFDAEGNREIADIRQEMQKLIRSEELSAEELKTRFSALYQRLKTVVDDHLVPAGTAPEPSPEPTGDAGDAGAGSNETTGESPSPTPTAREEATSPPEPEPSASASETGQSSPAPTP